MKNHPLALLKKPIDMSKEISVANRVPQVCSIEIEDIGSDLTDGVRLKPLKEVSFSPAIYSIKSKNERVLSDGGIVFEVESYLSADEMPELDQGVWKILDSNGGKLEKSDYYIITQSANYSKYYQKFILTPDNLKEKPCYFQLACTIDAVKVDGTWYKRGDVITLVAKSSDLPNPSIITVIPREEQTFVPLLPRQRLQILTEQNWTQLIFNLNGNSPVVHLGYKTIDTSISRMINEKVRFDFFDCHKQIHEQEVFFVEEVIKKRTKTIHLPVCFQSKDSIFCLIEDPVGDSVIHSENINGFVLQSRRKFYLCNGDTQKFSIVYNKETPNGLNEIKIRLIEKQKAVILNKKGKDWVLNPY